MSQPEDTPASSAAPYPRLQMAAPVLLTALEGLVDSHARGMPPSDAQWRAAIGALAAAKGGARG